MKVKRELCDAPASECITLMRCDVRDRSVPRRVREAIQMLRAIERRHRQLRPQQAEAGLFEKGGK
jgi:hypothetical protein